MGIFLILFIMLTVTDLITLIKGKRKQDLTIFSIFCICALAFAIFYYSDPFRPSLIMDLFKIFNIKVG